MNGLASLVAAGKRTINKRNTSTPLICVRLSSHPTWLSHLNLTVLKMPCKSNAQALLDLSDPALLQKKVPDVWGVSEVWMTLTKNKLPPWRKDDTPLSKSVNTAILSFVNKYWALDDAEARKNFWKGKVPARRRGKKNKGKVVEVPDNDAAGRQAYNLWVQTEWKKWAINDVILGELKEQAADPWSVMEEEGNSTVSESLMRWHPLTRRAVSDHGTGSSGHAYLQDRRRVVWGRCRG